MALLNIEGLSVDFDTTNGAFRAVDQVDLTVNATERVAIVGESGSGKSVSMLALMGLLPNTAKVRADCLEFDGKDMLQMAERQRRSIIGKDIAMIFQEPMSSLNPCYRVGYQINEVLTAHAGLTKKEANERAEYLFDQVGIPSPKERLRAYPHQLSGGMCQRVMIAMALAGEPKLLIADEPTTALDVTIQAQILDLLLELQQQNSMALIIITHDMGVVAQMAGRVSVQYAGQKFEEQSVSGLFNTPFHPYTDALLKALPERANCEILPTIQGVVPGQFDRPLGCLFAPRCQFAQEQCHKEKPQPQDAALGYARCFYPLQQGVVNE